MRFVWLCFLCGLLTLAVAACGGSRHAPTTSVAAQAGLAATTQTPDTVAPTATTGATAHRHAAKPRRSTSSTTTPAAVTTKPQSGPRVPTTRFEYQASQVCSQTGANIPPGHPPAGPEALRAYAMAALPSTVNTTIALQRLATNNRKLSQLAPLLVRLQRLAGLYRQVAFGQPGAVSTGMISSAQQAAERSARAVGLAQCGPGAHAGA